MDPKLTTPLTFSDTEDQCSGSECPPSTPPPPANDLVLVKIGGYGVDNKWNRDVEVYSANATCNTKLHTLPTTFEYPVGTNILSLYPAMS